MARRHKIIREEESGGIYHSTTYYYTKCGLMLTDVIDWVIIPKCKKCFKNV